MTKMEKQPNKMNKQKKMYREIAIEKQLGGRRSRAGWKPMQKVALKAHRRGTREKTGNRWWVAKRARKRSAVHSKPNERV